MAATKVQTRIFATIAAGRIEKRFEGQPEAALGPGFWIMIIETVLRMMNGCFDPDDGPEIKVYGAKRMDAIITKRRLIKGVTRQIKRAARSVGSRLKWAQALVAAEETINTGLGSSDTDLTLVIREQGSGR